MPKRKHSQVSQDMGYSKDNNGDQDRPRYVGDYRGHEMQQFLGDLEQSTAEGTEQKTNDAMDHKTVNGNDWNPMDHEMDQYIDYSRYDIGELHPDVDLALDNNYADDSQFLPSDSNIGLGHGQSTEPTTTYPEPIPNPRQPAPFYIGNIRLTPQPPVYPRSYYDEAPTSSYKFTTAAELLDESTWAVHGWSPSHYGGLTNSIHPPASAYLPRPATSFPFPIRRSCLHANHDLARTVGYMRRPITVMHQQGTGLVHPAFPTTWGAMALLTEAQLDGLAEFYHQTEWSEWWLQYPCPMFWRRGDGVWVKRRKMMEFIGIRKPQPPPVEVVEWLDGLEGEVERRLVEEREREGRREDLRRKMWSCSGGEL